MKTPHKQTPLLTAFLLLVKGLLLTFFIALLTLGILEAQYGIVRIFVRFICTSCMGLE